MSEHHRQVPVLRVTSETEEAPSPPSEESPTKAPVHPRLQFVRDEDANSTAPLLDSGSSTPVCEEPRTPLTLGSFLSSAAAASSGAAAGDDYEEEEIGMRSLSSADARLGQLPCSDRLAGPMAGPLGRWPWRLLRGLAAASALAAIVACCAVAAALIALLPDKCDPPTAWWQGAAFYTWRHAVDGHPLDDWNDADRFRWLDRQLHVDVVRIDSVLQQQQQRQQQQRQERKRFGFFFLFVFFFGGLALGRRQRHGAPSGGMAGGAQHEPGRRRRRPALRRLGPPGRGPPPRRGAAPPRLAPPGRPRSLPPG